METGEDSSYDEQVNLTASIKMTKALRLAKLKTKCEDVPRADENDIVVLWMIL